MNSSYLLGVFAAIGAGITFNLGLVFQKVAVSRTDPTRGLMKQLLRSPLWFGGTLLQFIIGVPLNMLANLFVGPTIAPGLMTTGLIVLALGAVWIAHESIGLTDILGILLVIAAVALIGLSRLGVNMKSPDLDLFEPNFLIRLAIFTGAVAAGSIVCHLVQLRVIPMRFMLRSINSGLFNVQSGLWLGVLMGLIALLNRSQASAVLIGSIILAGGLTTAGSFLGVTETQRAFQYGDATRVIPLQIAPQQILSLALFFLVFNLPPPDSNSVLFAGSGVILVLAGAWLLGRRQTAYSGADSAEAPQGGSSAKQPAAGELNE